MSDPSESVFLIGVFICIILFAGDPDIADGIVNWFMSF